MQNSALQGRSAVVTGASSGIGAAIARQLARAGAHVLVHAGRNQSGAERTAEAVRGCGCRSDILLWDLARADGHGELVEAAWQLAGPVDIWINNAGADVLTGGAGQEPFERKLQRLWRVDVRATLLLARLAGQRMAAANGGVILNMGWDQALWGMAGESGELFAAAKGAVMAFSRSLAQSLAPKVRVNCLAPGWIRTGWGAQASSAWQERAQRESLMERWGTPDDVAHMACFLCSDQAAFISGQTFCINGGFRFSPVARQQPPPMPAPGS